ncbi:DEAD/DEAH box helicase [Subtercola frigoramans]|uniref:ATP-dependent RNA helicase HelY n=1 Tax=Subtercola frigoramans TaxID=120298 RepID=A0ABS2L5J0_9MICO|nr:DEAD/DEAH box helicase [Subtercola frigoramans]MBM7472299.1 ATP-dependent RNA helicase HelY [Subtercola frigoramans]
MPGAPVTGASGPQTLSPAERYALSKAKVAGPLVDDFRQGLGFDLDPFQIESCRLLEAGNSVLVAAPTGAGKTIVAEFAVFMAMKQRSAKVFYTAPIKALSNQKFQEFVTEYGPDEVGLLTGDTNINPQARIVVMTTEVLRNMLYAESDLLTNLAFVVMDEVHYLADRFRGAVWEEVIIHLPASVRLVSLSATVSNAEEFGDWLQAVRGDTEVIVSEERPVPLDQHMLVRHKLLDLFDGTGEATSSRVNPELMRIARSTGAPQSRNRNDRRGRSGNSSHRPQHTQAPRMDRAELTDLLDEHNLLPAIFFIFSRVGCDQAVKQVLRAGVRLTTNDEREDIRHIVDERCRTLLDEDLAVLGYWEWLEGLERGVAAHHAGLLPAFKEVVEELFQKKLVRVVFATETLALGINMPARTVVLESLEKYNGEARVPITPGEYTQLTGRAGRRGIDVEGHSVIQWRDGVDPQAVASLASRRTYPLNSSFRPTYNMAVNLIDQFGRARTRDSLELSFAQFQADRAVVDLAHKVRQHEESLAGYEKSMTCHLGDFAGYAALRRELSDVERSGAGRADTQSRAERDSRQKKITELRRRMKSHPVSHCPDREGHARWAERWYRLKRETDQLVAQINNRTGAIAKVFDRICEVLLQLEYVQADPQRELTLTPTGKTLKRIYGERDLLVAECIRRGVWANLDPAGLAALACSLIYEPRRDESDMPERFLPRGPFRGALEKTQELWADLQELEAHHRLPGTSPISVGLAKPMHEWAKGASLDTVLFDADLAAGDFVRWTKQTIDLLDQLQNLSDAKVATTARLALDLVKRGIVAYSSVA